MGFNLKRSKIATPASCVPPSRQLSWPSQRWKRDEKIQNTQRKDSL